ncbi:hypothetical protein D3218_07620 [Aureimonas flava]|uniref:PilZ domain-containing protein n=1 Tax=Aureimonas flava TaxID=2320271 RepID=A0A3A1WQ80_9HYPH|nr:hypothetical protein [Aureimonas flava]RIY02152.1 hypothetical protein D3218_07620 [Aureimonas flava]
MRADRRGAARRTTRLRPGKLLGAADGFLCDCAVVDRSARGARIRAFAPVDRVLPEVLTLYDEAETRRWTARIVWARGAELGLAIEAGGERVSDAERHRIAGLFYAV